MAVTPEQRRWEALFAARTRGDVGEGIASVLAMLGMPDLISFAGGFPDPPTFPRERARRCSRSSLTAGEVERVPVRADARGSPGTRDALAGRIERLQGRRPADDELLITSGAIEALELVGKAFLDPGDLVVVEAPDLPRLDHGRSAASRPSSPPSPIDERRARRRRARGRARRRPARSCSTRSLTTRTRPA